MLANWKLIVHLLFGTYRFGVDNSWWSNFNSIFGKPWAERFCPVRLWKRYKMIRVRAVGCHFIPDADSLFPRYAKKLKEEGKG